MRLVTRYVFRELVESSLFTLCALLALYAFFDIVQEVSQVGNHHYTWSVMFNYVLLQVPGHCYQMLPLAVLIGCMVAMTQLVMHSEYTVLRTSGITLAQMAGILASFGVVCALITLLFGEWIAPVASHKGDELKLNATRAMVSQEFHSGIWVKDSNNIINIQEMLPDSTILGIRVYSYDNQFKLQRTLQAERGLFDAGNRDWVLQNVQETSFAAGRTQASRYPRLTWKSVLDPGILQVLVVDPEQTSAASLSKYIQHLNDNHQQTRRYQIAFWNKIFYPLACISMAILALAFTPRQRRQGMLGLRLFAGICLGVAFHFIDRLFSYIGLLHDWNPLISATLPTLLFLLLGLGLIVRQELRR